MSRHAISASISIVSRLLDHVETDRIDIVTVTRDREVQVRSVLRQAVGATR